MPSISVKDATGATQTINTLPAVGAAATAAALPVTLASDQSPVTIGNKSAIPSASFSRPADTTAYALGDLVANSTTAGSVVPMSLTVARVNAGTGQILRARLSKSGTSVTNASFRVHLFKTAPATVTNGDNGAFSVSGVAAGYLGFADITTDQAFTDGCSGRAIPYTGAPILFQSGAAVQTIYALIEARGAYTPVSAETFTVELEVVQD